MISASWWRHPDGFFNFGDEITTILLSELFSVEHKRESIIKADLLSTGSVLGWVFARDNWAGRTKPLSVVGSGFMQPMLNIPKRHNSIGFVKLYSVRGFLSQQLLGHVNAETDFIGDPGLLSSLIYNKRHSTKHKYGLIPHHSKVESDGFLGRFGNLEDLKVIDFRTDDHHKVFADMLSCDLIISQSLHGLIMADSFGIPNVWADCGALHNGGVFKFYDYFSSVGRPFDLKVTDEECITDQMLEDNVFEIGARKLREVQVGVVNSFVAYFNDFDINYSIKEY